MSVDRRPEVEERVRSAPREPKNPGVAAVLSFFITGLGQIYNGQLAKGLMCVLAFTVSWGLTSILIGWLFLLPLWVWGIFDAYRTAERLNRDMGFHRTRWRRVD